MAVSIRSGDDKERVPTLGYKTTSFHEHGAWRTEQPESHPNLGAEALMKAKVS